MSIRGGPFAPDVESKPNGSGGALGQDVEDWLQPERELLEEYRKIGGTAKATAA